MKEEKPRFELLEHTADIRIAAYGKDLQEVFVNMAFGLFSQIAELGQVQERESRDISIVSADVEGLLIDWLNELLFIFDVDNLVLKRFVIKEFQPMLLRATVYGERMDPTRHTIYTGVKAATYHQLEIEEKDGVTARVIFDV